LRKELKNQKRMNQEKDEEILKLRNKIKIFANRLDNVQGDHSDLHEMVAE